ncbi:hypothetical protein LINGRAPRIM_LOCUS2692 [Linum grandiflorum]
MVLPTLCSMLVLVCRKKIYDGKMQV